MTTCFGRLDHLQVYIEYFVIISFKVFYTHCCTWGWSGLPKHVVTNTKLQTQQNLFGIYVSVPI